MIFTKRDVILKKSGPYTSVVISKGVPRGDPGQPALPWRKFYVSVPSDAVIGELAVEEFELALLAEDVVIEPCQPVVPLIRGMRVEWVPPDGELYESETLWPEVFARAVTVRRMGGFAMAEIEVCPFRYHPRSKKLYLVEQLSLGLTYTQTGEVPKVPGPAALRHRQKVMERVRGMVLNPEDVAFPGRPKEVEGLE